ncbi:Na+-transporting NADH:ubiquinone oxidoreductase subunit A [Lishizhenia tianjinensis]|uniref:Na(+)-translocating NADH-quinone reductase subunit A n=1 Tax=Lishizhenia tianjinensis TaxID=477690 RepID=A0A1I7AEH0_9FLAO|nr:Na(+)-translocating NADH-quinone reductase subunit A [Lishizhenia tianjinensis]SFT73342.1 Na+-transporting NADH:ubiquinone oxidoreductase subunit A [Lishizhenia tianjinensis]
MSKTVKLRKGLDIRLVGEADKVTADLAMPKTVSIKPTDFHGLVPKMAVKPGDKVQAGSVIFFDKYNDAVKYVSPVSGEIAEIVRGEKRRILEVRINADANTEYVQGSPVAPASADAESVKQTMLSAGLWPFITQRPLGVVANPEAAPKAIFISGFDSAPLAPDYDFILHGQDEAFQAGVDALAKLTTGKVYLGLNAKVKADAALENAKNVVVNRFEGKHPAGNVGTQIHHIDPINKGEFVFTVNVQDVVIIGKYFLTGKFDATKLVAYTGSEATNRKYYKTVIGANVADLVKNNVAGDNVRVVSGNALTGTSIGAEGCLSYYDNQITILPEGDQYKFFLTKGWLGPGFDKFSASKLFPTWLNSSKKYTLDTNLNGEERGFVVTGEMERVFPFDILPMQLIKACITDDIDGMENLGIYEVVPEDFALCEYVCTSKVEIQEKVRQGLDLIQKECM